MNLLWMIHILMYLSKANAGWAFKARASNDNNGYGITALSDGSNQIDHQNTLRLRLQTSTETPILSRHLDSYSPTQSNDPANRRRLLTTKQPSGQPSGKPSGQPSRQPSSQPSSSVPSAQPFGKPSGQPSGQPKSGQPSKSLRQSLSSRRLSGGTSNPTSQPSALPSGQPSSVPSG